MPRTYKKKGVYKQHDIIKLEAAVFAIKSGTISYGKAVTLYGIPKSTLRDHVKGRVGSGRPPAIPEKIENEIADNVSKAAAMGFGISRKQLLIKTGHILKIQTPLKESIPGVDWWESFHKRHPELSIRRPEKLSQSRVRMMNWPIVEEYFQTLNQTLDNLDIMDKPERMWNLDETGIIMEHTPSSVIAKRGSKSVPGSTSNSRECITVVVTANASGRSLPPMIIVRGKTRKALNAWNVGAGPEGAFWTYQSKAWIEDILARSGLRKYSNQTSARRDLSCCCWTVTAPMRPWVSKRQLLY